MNYKDNMSFIIPLKRDLNAYEDNARAFDEKIDVCKEHANPNRYFNIFAKHLKKFPNGGLGRKIALVDLSNLEVDKLIIDLNPRAEYVLIDNFLDYKLLKAICPTANLSLIYTDDGILEQFEELHKLNIDMKFDVIVGNPPYSHGLHMKILVQAMKYIADGGDLVWLCPIKAWLKSDFFNVKPPIDGTFVSDIVNCDIANDLFQISTNDLGIVVNHEEKANKSLTSNRDFMNLLNAKLSAINSIYLRKSKTYKEFSLNIAENSCRFNLEKDGRITDGCYQIVATRREDAFARKKLGPSTVVIDCSSKQEREFAYCFYRSKFMRFVYRAFGFGYVPGRFVPDYRSLTSDFSKPWSNEQFYEYFNLTEDEVKLIEETIKK